MAPKVEAEIRDRPNPEQRLQELESLVATLKENTWGSMERMLDSGHRFVPALGA